MKKSIVFIFAIALTLVSCSDKRSGIPRVLVFTKTAGNVHESIPAGIKAIEKLGNENGFEVDASIDASLFNDEYLSQYSTVIFLNTTENILDTNQEVAFERYIQSGGGFVGIHSAADTEYDWFWYAKLVGAQFLSHPHYQKVDFLIKDKNSKATEFFTDDVWTRTDELYNFKNMNQDVNVLLTIDESTYEGGENGENHPMSWYHEYDGGRAFYTALGHTEESFSEELYLKHILGGIQYAIGDNKKLNYKKATSQYPPDPVRFEKKSLSLGKFFEPTEMAILPNLDVLIAQRRGEIMYYNNATGELSEVAKLDVYHKASTPGVNAEEGIMGLQKDPNFEQNNWVYVFYAPTGDEWVNRLSRFTFKDGVFDLDSEVKVLDVDSQREICCHTGGSIAFGGDGLLYLSTGDNTTPFDEKGAKYVTQGYGPMNDLPGKKQFDARRSSANTNDLRGKIIRIRVNDDGSYDIPDGNLFPVGMDNTRPEIYTMGHRNPYRISVDPKNGYLYWGDVGPDAEGDSELRGPRGHDEFGQAKEAGNYGWPLFVADNKAYRDFDYETGESGAYFDENNPINDSRYNTGLKELPPAQPALIWYPYNKSTEFPQLGSGSRNAMAGPAYYTDLYPEETALPEYYNGKVIIYEWMRGWMSAVSLFENGDFKKMEPFAPNVQLNNLIDMEVAPNGQIYLLEYGSAWFQQNEDSGLSILQYNGGNLLPTITNVSADKESGLLPLEVNISVEASDLESEQLQYIWNLGNGESKVTSTPNLNYTYTEGGDYKVQVSVKDEQGATVKSEIVAIVAGNEMPKVSIELIGANQSFYIPGKAIEYKVHVEDENSSTPVDLSNVYVSVDYMEGFDKASMDLGHKQVAASVMGKSLTQSMDCRACHKEDAESIGPSYMKVSARYKDDENAQDYLSNKIKSGGGGVWGENVMAAHPDISDEDLRQITAYILSLAIDEEEKATLPMQGTIIPEQASPGKSMIITASYTDAGEANIKALTGTATKMLASNSFNFSEDTEVEGFDFFEYNGNDLLVIPKNSGWFSIKDVDLTGVSTATIMAGWQGNLSVGLDFELHLDAIDGPLVGKGSMSKPRAGQARGMIPVKIQSVNDGQLHKLYFTYVSQDPTTPVLAGLIMVQFN